MKLDATTPLEITIKIENKGYERKISGTAEELGVAGWSYPEDNSPDDWYWNEDSEQLESFYSKCFAEFMYDMGSYAEWNEYEWGVKVMV